MQSLYEILKENNEKFIPIIPQLKNSLRLLPISFGLENTELSDINYNNVEQFSNYITQKIDSQNKLVAYGGYLEDREMYKRSKLFKAGNEIRTIHLGIDLWVPQETPVSAFYKGTIHSFGVNNEHGDYGGVVILKHEIHNHTFYTLYGHLSHKSVQEKTKGQVVDTGEVFAWVGSPSENGYWPTHLHVQIITNLLKYDIDFPGTCTPTNKEYFNKICPNPSIILGLP